jgi:hypothetical protein
MALTYPKSDLSPAMNNAISKWANSGIRDILIGSKNFFNFASLPSFLFTAYSVHHYDANTICHFKNCIYN